MRRFASIYNDYEFVQRVVAQIPWRTNITLMEKLDDNHSREWYAFKTIENGWRVGRALRSLLLFLVTLTTPEKNYF